MRCTLQMKSRTSRYSLARFVIVVAFILAAGQRAGAAPDSTQAVSLQDYISTLDRCSSTLANSGTNPAAIHNLRMSLPDHWTVSAGNQSYAVSADWLSSGLARVETAKHDPKLEVRLIEEQIAAHREAAQALARVDSSSRGLDESKSQLNRILAAKEYQSIHGPTWWDLMLGRVWSWIRRQFEKLFERFSPTHSIGNVIAWTVIVIVGLLLLVWAVRATSRLGARPEMDLRGANATGQDSAYWLRQAREAAARSDYRAAIHAAYWAAIARMEEAKLLSENRSRTPRESLRLLRRESAEYAPLLQLTRRFELVWYGYRAADSTDWSDAVKQLENLGCLRSSTPAISAS
jgi:Domain of unknown function (DUF4129)